MGVWRDEISDELLHDRLAWFIRLRWCVVAALGLAGAGFALAYPSSASGWGLALSGGILAATNLAHRRILRRRSFGTAAWLQVLTDLVILTGVTSLVGGTRTPLVALYLLHVILAGFVLSTRGAIATALLSGACMALLGLLPCPAAAPLLRQTWVPLAGLIPLLGGGAYLVTKMIQSERAAHHRVRQEKVLMSLVLENMQEGVALLDPDGERRFCNPAARRVADCNVCCDRGRVGTRCPLRDPSFLEPVLARFRAGECATIAVDHTVDLRDYSSTFTPIRTEGSRLDSVLWILRDVTERRHLEHREKMAALGRLTAGLAHEIGNPLASISGLVQVLRRRPGMPAEELDLAYDQVQRIARIVRDVTTFSRHNGDPRGLVEFNRVIHDSLRVASIDNRWKRFELTLDFHEPSPIVRGSADKLHQVFLNLLLNAADAMETGGRLAVSTSVEDGHAVARVRDSGPGIPPEIRERIFEPFFTTKPPGRGTGLGLAVARSLVVEHGGTLGLAEGPGGGSVFTVRIPREEAPCPTAS